MRTELISKKAITRIDIQLMIAVCVCCMTSNFFYGNGWKFSCGDMKLEIIQRMTACIACLLCCQENTRLSVKAGVNRLIITVIGGGVGIFVVLLDILTDNPWLLAAMISLGVLFTLFLCKAANVPYINARIGGVTFILVVCTLGGAARIWYAVFRFISTIYGVMVVLLVAWVFERWGRRRH